MTATMNRPQEGTLLELRDVRTHFTTARGVVRAVDGVSFTLDRGKSLGIVGESGSGKTILARSIMGLLPKRGTIRHGEILYAGQDLASLSLKGMRKFNASARHPRMIAALHANFGIFGDLLSGLQCLGVTDIDMASHDERLRACLAFGKPAINDQLVQSCFFCRHVATR